MKLQQLRYIVEVYRQNLNVSEAAETLFTSQPGVSKQIRMLEDELGVQIFVRQGKRLVAVTRPGLLVLELAQRILRETQNMKKIGDEYARRDSGRLVVATSHTQARYVLPQTVGQFAADYPDVALTIQTGTPSLICTMVAQGAADIGIVTEEIDMPAELCSLPCDHWNRVLIVPHGHELLTLERRPTLEDIARFALITYSFAFEETSPIARAFAAAQIDTPRLALSSADTDVIKTYVRLGLGVGLVAAVAFDGRDDHDLAALDVSHLFADSPIQIVLRRDDYLRGFAFDFIGRFAPHLDAEKIRRLMYTPPAEDYSI